MIHSQLMQCPGRCNILRLHHHLPFLISNSSAVACVLIMAIAITCGVMFAPKKDNSPISNYYYVQVSAGADKATAAADEKTDGAKITLTLNSEETVETVRAENVDGDMILHLSGELKGSITLTACWHGTKPHKRTNR